MGITREALHQAIDSLSTASLSELGKFIAYLHFKEKSTSSGWLAELYESFAPVREAVEASGMSEAEIDTMIDDAINDVRKCRAVLDHT